MRTLFSYIVVAALLAGCGGSQPPIGAPNLERATHETSGSGSDLIYVSTANGVVYLSYPAMKVLGTLPGDYEGEGVCSDPNNGKVYVAEGSDVVVYAHRGTSPIATLTPPSGYFNLYECSVDPNSGNLAVSATLDESRGNGAILVYARGSGSAVYLSNSENPSNIAS